MELREAVAEDVNAVYRGARGAQGAVNGGGKGGGKGEVTSAEVAITAGCNLAFAVAAMTLAGPGDRIVIPTPWVSVGYDVERRGRRANVQELVSYTSTVGDVSD